MIVIRLLSVIPAVVIVRAAAVLHRTLSAVLRRTHGEIKFFERRTVFRVGRIVAERHFELSLGVRKPLAFVKHYSLHIMPFAFAVLDPVQNILRFVVHSAADKKEAETVSRCISAVI